MFWCSPTPATPLEFALTKNAPVSALERALTNSLDLKSFGIRTYKKDRGERGQRPDRHEVRRGHSKLSHNAKCEGWTDPNATSGVVNPSQPGPERQGTLSSVPTAGHQSGGFSR